jgi:hypothetical protein
MLERTCHGVAGAVAAHVGRVIVLVCSSALRPVIIYRGFQVTPQETSMGVRSGEYGGHSTGPFGPIHCQTNLSSLWQRGLHVLTCSPERQTPQ